MFFYFAAEHFRMTRKLIKGAPLARVIPFRHYYYYLFIFLITFPRNVIEIRFHDK